MNLFLITGLVVFLIGTLGALFRKDAVSLFMCVEVVLNGVNITFVGFARLWGNLEGQMAVFFIIAVAAAEAAVGLGLMLLIYKQQKSIQLTDLTNLRELRW